MTDDASAPANGSSCGMLVLIILGIVIAVIVNGAKLSTGPRLALSVAQVTANPTTVDAEELARNLDTLQGKPVCLTATAQTVTEKGDYIDAVCRIGNSESLILASYKKTPDIPKLLAGDIAVMWGISQGMRSYKAKGQKKLKLPAFALGLLCLKGKAQEFTVTGASATAGQWEFTLSRLTRDYDGGDLREKSGCTLICARLTVKNATGPDTLFSEYNLPVITAIDGVKCEAIKPDGDYSQVMKLSGKLSSGESTGGMAVYFDVPYPLKSVTFRCFGTSVDSAGYPTPDPTQSKELTVTLQ